MEKRHFNRKRCLATAVAAAAFIGFAHNADAALSLELTPSGGSPDGSDSPLAITNLDALTLDVWATVTATGSGRQGLQIAEMGFYNTGGGAITGVFSATAPPSPWNNQGSSAGTANGSDWGGTNTAVATGYWIAISDAVEGNPSNNTTYSTKLGSITFDPGAGVAGDTAALSLVPRSATQGALWFEDATVTDPGGGQRLVWSNDKNPSNGTVNAYGLNLSFAGVVGTPNLWAAVASGNWSTTANWDTGTAAGGPDGGAAVTFAKNASGPLTVTVDAARTVGNMTFNANATTYTVAAGSNLTVNAGSTIDTGGGNHTITGTVNYGGAITKAGAGTLNVTNVRSSGTLSVNAGTLTVATEGGTTGASKVGGLSMGGGTLDLKDNDMVVVSTPISGIRTSIFGGTITTTGTPPLGKTARLGYAQGSDVTIPNLSGQSYAATDSLIKFTYEGDADLDGDVDLVDVGFWSGNFTGSGGSSAKLWTEGDWDYDGDVDLVDVGSWSGNFTGSGGGVLSPPLGGVGAVPEPSSLTLLGLAALPMLRRRRK